MGRRPIILWGDPRLVAPNAPIETFDQDLQSLIDEMFETSWAAPGLGLAAPQIGVNLRLAVLDLSVGKDPDQKIVLANPEIARREGKVSMEEGCLSFPGLFTTFERPRSITVRSQDAAGKWREIEAEDLLAQALCHEIDHLNGTLLIDHIRGLKRKMFIRRVKKLQQAGEWA
ncbi:MAG: peptide deformylase [Acidobacteriota bacterium]